LTRENKIALVVGFAILLVVGVLLSDHLAQAARGQAADMSSINDPTTAPPGNGIIFVPLTGGLSGDQPDATDTRAEEPPLPLTITGDQSPMHVVKEGETLSSIAQNHYGNARLAGALGASNPLPDPDNLAVGLRLLIPPRDELAGGTPTEPTEPVVTLPTYTVKDGDTLSELAQTLMGTMHAADKLLALNRGTLKGPRGLRAGMTLRYEPPATP